MSESLTQPKKKGGARANAGRPTKHTEIEGIEFFRKAIPDENCLEVIAKLLEIVRFSNDENAIIKAGSLLLDRRFGKAKEIQQIDATVETNLPNAIERALLKVYKKSDANVD